MSIANEYIRRLYDNIVDWYKSADTKAQVILAMDGAFIVFLTGSVFSKPDELQGILSKLTTATWVMLGLMALCVFGSMGASIYCLWSRIYSKTEAIAYIDRHVEEAQKKGQYQGIYPPAVMWFFQFLERLDLTRFKTTLESVDESFERESLIEQAQILSGNVRRKHTAVNVGFVLVALALVLFFFAAALHIVTIVSNH